MDDAFQLTIDGAPDLRVQRFDVTERADLEARAIVLARTRDPAAPLDLDALVGAKATLDWGVSDANTRTPRRFHGIVDAIEIDAGGVSFTLVARVMPLADGCDHRVFLDQDAVAIAKDVLGTTAGLDVDVRVPSTPRPRKQTVQAFESPLAFVRRILAEDGISIWVEHTDEKDVVVLGGDASSCADLPGGAALTVLEDGALVQGEAVMIEGVSRRRPHDGAEVVDYDPDHPAVDLNASVGGKKYPLFVFPGHHASADEGKARAQLLLEASNTDAVVLRARTTCRHVAVGFVVELSGGAREEHNGRFRVMEVHHRGGDSIAGPSATGRGAEIRYEATLVAIPADRQARPARVRPDGFGGLQSMTVTGASGQEIHTDDQGRVKARFRWDRDTKSDDTSSTWVRPMQPPLSGGFFLPRVGWEVLVGFMSDPVPTGDTPLELGRLVNGQMPPAESLPGQKVRSNWGSLTTPGGGSMNQLRLDDAAGAEGMLVVASNDLNERTENDRVATVKADESNTIDGDSTTSVTLQQITNVVGAQTYTIGGNRTVTTTGIFGIGAASEAVAVGGNRDMTIGGDYETKCATLVRVVGAAENVVAIQEANRHVTGASAIAVGGTWAEIGGVAAAVGVLGASALTSAGPLSIRASNVSINASVLSETYAGAYSASAGGKFTLEAPTVKLQAGAAFKAKGADIVFKAKSKITVKAGGVTITITPGSVKVNGKVKGDATSVVTTKEEIP